MKKSTGLTVLNPNVNAINCDDKHKVIEGYLVSVQTKVGKYKSNIYQIKTKTGEDLRVWGGTAIDKCLMEGKTLKPELVNKFIQLTFRGSVKLGEGRNAKTFQDIQVACNPSDSLVGTGKIYRLKK
jgi:hypothetical protein